ncbi:hypothetical protein LSAT2_023489 [Lamellibrachia satsuma]|nr:hypothetical protein LSAT2_023489 [Lamellibrachia satsuma]
MSYVRGVCCLVFLAAVGMLVAADDDFNVGKSEVKVAAESGMMEFRRERRNKANETVQTRPVQIRMAQMVQLDKDGNEVTNCTAPEKPVTRRRRRSSGQRNTQQKKPGSAPATGGMGQKGSGSRPSGKGGKPGSRAGKGGMGGDERSGSGRIGVFKRPHRPWAGRNGTGLGKRFSNFNHTKFNIGKKKRNERLSHSRSLRALVKRFYANLGAEVGNMAVDMALPENDGEIDIDGEKQKLKKGDLKFNIELTEWNWCGDEGEDGAAAFLDVYIEVNSTHRPNMRRGRSASAPASFDLGDNTTMSFSGKFQKDGGNWTNVVDGYPKVDDSDPSLVIVRFTRFNSSLLYDPTVSAEDEAVDGDSSGAVGHSVSAIFVTTATALSYALLK